MFGYILDNKRDAIHGKLKRAYIEHEYVYGCVIRKRHAMADERCAKEANNNKKNISISIWFSR